MSIGLPDIKLLWGRAGGLCNICRTKLSEEKKISGGSFPFGEQAHIVAEENDGPRGNSPLSLQQRNSYANLILLCPTCHTKIDKSPEEYPIELLHDFKSQHELWFEKTRVSKADKVKQANEYIYAELVDAAAKLCMFDDWEMWTSWALASPMWQRKWTENVEEFRRRIIRAVWPGTIPELERALKTLSINLAMALNTFSKHCELGENGVFNEVRFYRHARSSDEYDELLDRYNNAWIDEQRNSLHAATKSANWVAEIVRRELNPLFFAVPGKFVVTGGPNMTGAYVTQVLEFSEDEKKSEPEAVFARFSAKHEVEQRAIEELKLK